jgi:hypothetical protein
MRAWTVVTRLLAGNSHLNGISVYSLAGADIYTSTRIPDVERRPVDMPAPREDGPLSRDAGRQSRKSTPESSQ